MLHILLTHPGETDQLLLSKEKKLNRLH